MADDLKPCPFCGGTEIEVSESEAACLNCGAETAMLVNTEAEAIAAWNRRVDDSADEREADHG